MDEFHLNKKDSVTKFSLPNAAIGLKDNGNIYTPNEMRLREISAKIQKDMEKEENIFKYNMDNINEQKEKLAIYLKSIDKNEINFDISEEAEEEIRPAVDMRAIAEKLQSMKPKNKIEDPDYKYTLQNSNQMANYLESKIELLSAYKKRKFNEYYKNKKTEDGEGYSQRKNPLFETKKINEVMNKNTLRIEKQLMNLFDLEDTSSESESEEGTLKKIKTLGDSSVSIKQVGYKINDFFKIPKYRMNPMKLPFFSNLFEDAVADMAAQQRRNEKQAVKKDEFGNPTQDSSMANSKKFNKPEIPMFFDDMKKKALNEKDKEGALVKFKQMTKAEQEKHEEKLWKKQWQNVVRGVVRIYRYTQKFKMNVEQECKKFAILCAKEVKKKAAKSHRTARDYVFRGKRMHREMIVYWRKREKELAELKKKKEKLEAEIKKREEEERETLLQKKRLEFLMKQSDIYAHFMAQKLGMKEDDNNADGIKQAPIIEGAMMEGKKFESFTGDKVEIDEEAAFASIQGLINEQRESLKIFDLDTQRQRVEAGGPEGHASNLERCDITDLKLATNDAFDFSTVTLDPSNKAVNTPRIFKGELKEYQLKGLRWLDNLFEQGINGILADEMGLGKTIQAIALMSHISDSKGNYGPFLVVAPASTLFNWQQEINRFSPNLRVLPYWGSLKERKTIRKFFQQRLWGAPQSQFHVVITSYQLIVADEKAFQRLRWQYMILDEAQAIKNINSQRWKILLSFNTRNKLLLTGTPIQNSMAELWALLHFIMPKLFDSHEQFQEWFSKDIEAHSTDQKALNQHQLQRLHAILKPFMLRRVKKDVENEIGQKRELQILCEMTKRQQELYNSIKRHLSIKDFFQMFESKAKVDNLMNLVMQFRKVCNHPELFERRQCKTPFSFRNFGTYTGHIPVPFGQIKEIRPDNKNPIVYELPKLVFDELLIDFNGKEFISKTALIKRKFCLWDSDRIHNSLFGSKDQKIVHNFNIYSFSRFIGLNPNFVELAMKYDQVYTMLILLHYMKTLSRINTTYGSLNLDSKQQATKNSLWINRDLSNLLAYQDSDRIVCPKSVQNIREMLPYNLFSMKAHITKALSNTIRMMCSSTTYVYYENLQAKPRVMMSLIMGSDFQHSYNRNSSTENIPRMCLSWVPIAKAHKKKILLTSEFFKKGIFERDPEENVSQIEIPSFESLIADSCKLQYLNKLLPELKRKGHRVLIFCQMTKMMDILEEYLSRRKYQFFRLDGSCNVADRRDMVKEFQENDKIFAFILSTRAGGLGVTLTAADVVIFYDNDWNPTMDAQATDRAHRIGQKKDVYVYRLITKATIEEKIVIRAHQKQTVQATVYSGGAFKADSFKPQDVMELIFDKNEMADVSETHRFIAKAGTRKKGFKKEKKEVVQPKRESSRNKPRQGDKKDDGAMKIEKKGGEDGEEKEGMDVEFDFFGMINGDGGNDDE